MQLNGARDAGNPPRIRGWLLVYVGLLAFLLLHGTALTIGSIVIYANPAAAGLHSFVPLSFLLFYVITNVILVLYGISLFILMSRRLRSAIANNTIFNILSVAFLLAWHLFGEKSNFGTLVDSAPNLVGVAYILLSRRVRSTFILRPRSGPVEEAHSAASAAKMRWSQ
jgi:hypothetical protein